MSDRVALFLLTGFGAGYLRPGPGTFGSAVGVAFLVAAHLAGAEWGALPVALLFFLATWKLGDRAEALFGRKDPPSVVSDEVCGVIVAAAFTEGIGSFWYRALAAFILFRVFDIAKPWPIRRFEKLPGGLGIAADDVVAGVLANLVLRAGFAFVGRTG